MPTTMDDDLTLQTLRALAISLPIRGQALLASNAETQRLLGIMIAQNATSLKLLQSLLERLDTMGQTNQQQFDDILTATQSDITAQTTVANGLKAQFAGLSALLAAALASAKSQGASDAQLAAFRAIDTGIKTNMQTMIDATVTGTAAAAEPPAPIVPGTVIDDTGASIPVDTTAAKA